VSDTQTVWSGVFAALHPQHLYQYNLHRLDRWITDLLAVPVVDQQTTGDNQDLQIWYEALRTELQQQPLKYREQYAHLIHPSPEHDLDIERVHALKAACHTLQQQVLVNLEQLQRLQEVVPDLALQLQHTTRQIWLDRRQHEQISLDLDEAIKRLEQDIQSFRTSIIALMGVSGLALGFGGLTTGLLWPFGGLVWLILVPTLVVMLLLWRTDYTKLLEDQRLLQSKRQLVQQLHQQMTIQHHQMTCYHAWLAQTATMQQRVGQILAAWHTLERDIGISIAQLDSVLLEHQRGHQRAALQHWEHAHMEWRAAYEHIQALCIHPLPTHAAEEAISVDHVLDSSRQPQKIYQQQ
jgi:hypothetical protein